MDIRSFTVTGLAALSLGLGSLQVVCAENVAPPPAPRPWDGQASSTSTTSTGSTTSSSTKTEANGSRLRVSDQAAEEAQTQSNKNKPQFATNTYVRTIPSTGLFVGGYVGTNFTQDPETATVNGTAFNYKSEMGFSNGATVGYIWPFKKDSEIEQFSDEFSPHPVMLSGGLQLDAFGSYIFYGDTATNTDALLSTSNFLLTPSLQLQIDRFRVYAGPSIGFVYASYTEKTLGVVSSDDDVTWAWGAKAGVNYFLYSDWAIYAEYDYVQYQDLSFSDRGSNLSAEKMDNHFLFVGFKYFFSSE